MDWTLVEAYVIMALIFVGTTVAFIGTVLFILRSWVATPAKIVRLDYSGRVSEYVKAVGFGRSDFTDAYKSSLDEHLIFLRNGLISDSPGIIYIPYRNISSVTKELCRKAYLVTVEGDALGRECVILKERRSGKYPLVRVTRRPATSDEQISLKKIFDEDGGVVVFENINPEAMDSVEKAFKRFDIAVSEIPCKVK
ncbi:MAG: hypothetical protein V1861_00545 [Candidatus Micrarchaeota archaeon]